VQTRTESFGVVVVVVAVVVVAAAVVVVEAMAPASTGTMRLPGAEPTHVLQGHAGGVLAVSWTKNGRYVMSGSQDKTIRLWNPHSGVHVKTYKGAHNQEVNAVLISDDNAKFASAGGDKDFFLWDVTTAQVVRKFTGHERKINSLAWGPKEEVLISASHDKTLRIWDMRARGKGPIQILSDATDSILTVCVAGNEIISGSVDGGLRRYDVRKGQCITDQLLQPIGSISLSSDGQCFLVSTLDSKIRLIERDSGSELTTYTGHVNTRVRIQSTLDVNDSFVVSGSEDNRLCFWELVDGTVLGGSVRRMHGSSVLCVAFFEDTLVSASLDGELKVWNPELGPGL